MEMSFVSKDRYPSQTCFQIYPSKDCEISSQTCKISFKDIPPKIVNPSKDREISLANLRDVFQRYPSKDCEISLNLQEGNINKMI